MREVVAAGVAALATVGLLGALSAVVEARAGLATALLAGAVALLVTRPLQRRLTPPAPEPPRFDESDVPAAVVEVLTEALRLPFAAVELRAGEGFERVAARGDEPLHVVALDAAPGARIVVGGADFAAAREIARHAGPALEAARLARELDAEQERLAATRDEERGKLSAELHDRVGPALAG
jgi:signal transduction histidine kinase